MYCLGTILYSTSRYLPYMRKILYKRATKTDPVLARIMLLLEFENVPLAVENVEEFRDSKSVQHNLSTELVSFDTFTRSKISLFEEQLPSIVKLSKLQFQTRAENTTNTLSESLVNESPVNESHASESQLSQLVISSEEPQLELKDTNPQPSSSEEPEFVEMESLFANSSKESVATKAPLIHPPQETQISKQCSERIKKTDDLLTPYQSSIHNYINITNMEIVIMEASFIVVVGIILFSSFLC